MDMDKRQLTTILYLAGSAILFIGSILNENPLLAPLAVILLVLGGFHSEARGNKGF